MGCIIGRAFGDCTRLIMGGQETKVGKGRDQGAMGMSECGRIVG